MAKAKPGPAPATPGGLPRPNPLYENLEMRQIDNGYVVRHSKSGPNDQYHSKETFHPTKPKLLPKTKKK